MFRLNLPLPFIILLFTFNLLYAKEASNLNVGIKNNDFTWIKTDEQNLEFKVEKKQKTFNYAIKSKLGKYGYEDLDFTDNYELSLYNEDLYRLGFYSSVFFYDDLWLDFNVNYTDISRNILDTKGNLAYKKKSIKQQSMVKLFYKLNSFITSNVSFENIDNSIDYDKFAYQSFSSSNNNKFSFNINTQFDSFIFNTSFFQILKDNNYTYTATDADNYLKNTEELYRGIEVSLSKQIYEDLNLITSAKFINMEILDSNSKELLDKKPAYTPNKELDFKAEYLFKDIKLIGKVTYVADRYANTLNSEKLDNYTIESVGATFFTQFNNEDVKVDINVRNILDKDYYIYSDTKGNSRNYIMNLSMEF